MDKNNITDIKTENKTNTKQSNSINKQPGVKFWTLSVMSFDKNNHIIIAKDKDGTVYQITDHHYKTNTGEYKLKTGEYKRKNENRKP